ncbi:MAG: asparagine synthetase B, partial [Patescibacteria group bacterium]
MCGINGITDESTKLVERMNSASRHRGPDGTRIVEEQGVTLGFNRLAIIDLSEAAMQPMQAHSGRYIIIFNGEIYNYKELKQELAPYPF